MDCSKLNAASICMTPPSLKDLACSQDEVPNIETAKAMLLEVSFLLQQVDKEDDLKMSNDEISTLHMRKSSVLSLLHRPVEAKHHADIAVYYNPSAASYYRLGVANYMLGMFDAASEAFMRANEKDVSSSQIRRALEMTALRCQSKKDRACFIEEL